jgi:uncharacterized protein
VNETNPRARLAAVLQGFDRLAVAVSGGVDSMTLAWVAGEVLERRARMFHAVSAAVPPEATARVRAHAARAGWDLAVIDAGEMSDPAYLANPVDRCWFCKTDLYGTIRSHTDWPMASGANLDDLGDFRPGLGAAREHGVRHPLIEAGIAKTEVRAMATSLGLDDLAELPAAPCLSSRIETGIPVTIGRLTLILEAERLLAARLPGTTLRCRLRQGGLGIELDQPALDALSAGERADLCSSVAELARRHGVDGGIALGPYVRGSAFLRADADGRA